MALEVSDVGSDLPEDSANRPGGSGDGSGEPNSEPGSNVVDGMFWKNGLVLDSNKQIIPNLGNIITILANDKSWDGSLGFDEFTQRIAVRKRPPISCEVGEEWTDYHDLLTTAWLQLRAHRIKRVSYDVVSKAVSATAMMNRFHSLRDELDLLVWDGVQRLDKWLPLYAKTEDTVWSNIIGAKFLISAVARAYIPGSKVDTMLVLEGKQGNKKSSTLELIAGRNRFADHLAEIGSRDAATQMQGAWIIELQELDGITKQNVEKLKADLRIKEDRHVGKWERHARSVKRGCVFAGTVNKSQYLHDETGNRSFWPTMVEGEIDLDALRKDRGQVLAEAVARYKAGERWWLEGSENDLAREEQESRQVSDPWDTVVSEYLVGEESVSIAELLAHIFRDPRNHLHVAGWDQKSANRVAKVLIRLRWKRKQVRGDQSVRSWRYFPHDSDLDQK